MRRMREFAFRLGALVRGRRVEREIDREMAFHIQMETDALVRTGLPLDEARRRAHVAFGGRQRFREETRDEVRSRPIEDLIQDVRHALRAFGRAPAFTVTVLASLCLGIGATTVIFSVTDHVVLRPLPYANADRLASVEIESDRLKNVTPTWPANAASFLSWKDACDVCEAMAAIRPTSLTLLGDDDPTRVGVLRVSDVLFTMLGAHAELGRLFVAGDDRPGNEHSVIITDALWRLHLGARRDIIGRPISLGVVPSTVVGVLPPDFHMLTGHELGALVALPKRTDAFLPLALNEHERTTHGEHDYGVIVLLKRGASPEGVRARLDAISGATRLANDTPLHTVVRPLQSEVVGAAGRPLVLLLAAVGAMLLMLCVNLATLFLARSAARRRESAVRVALGAARGRLIRQVLTETLALSLAGGAAGIAFSRWGLRALVARAPADLPRLDEVHLDARVLLVALALSAIVGLAFGLVPALRFGRVDPGEVLNESGGTGGGARGAIGSRHSGRVQAALIASQVALSALLLVAAGLFLRSFVRVMHADRGFTAERVLALDVSLPGAAYASVEARNQFYLRALPRLASLPGVTSVAATNALPLEGESWIDGVWRHDDAGASESSRERDANLRFITPSLFSVLGIPLEAGRTFTDADRGQRRVILSANVARTLWPNENAVGRLLHVGSDSLSEVIGVAADVRTTGIEHEASLTVYRPYWEMGYAPTILLRTSGDPTSVAASARRAIREVASSVPVSNVRTMGDVVSASVARRRFELVLIALFALTALLTASVGIYGIISHSLGRRANEIGVRIALGARSLDVHTLVLREVLGPVAGGLAAGLVASLLLGRVVAGLLFEVRPTDAVTLVTVACVLGSVALLAAWFPSRRATRIDPVDALRAG